MKNRSPLSHGKHRVAENTTLAVNIVILCGFMLEWNLGEKFGSALLVWVFGIGVPKAPSKYAVLIPNTKQAPIAESKN